MWNSVILMNHSSPRFGRTHQVERSHVVSCSRRADENNCRRRFRKFLVDSRTLFDYNEAGSMASVLRARIVIKVHQFGESWE